MKDRQSATFHPSELTAHLGFWMRTVSNHVSQAFAAKLTERGVTVAEWVLLRALFDKEPTSPSRVADNLGLTRGAITRLADRLCAKGLLVREATPQDGRGQTLALTRRGATLVPELAELADRNDAEFFGGLSAADRTALERVLRHLVQQRGMTTTPTD